MSRYCDATKVILYENIRSTRSEVQLRTRIIDPTLSCARAWQDPLHYKMHNEGSSF